MEDLLIQPKGERVGRQWFIRDNDRVVPGILAGFDASQRSAPTGLNGSGKLVRRLVQACLDGSAKLGLAADLPNVEQQSARLRLDKDNGSPSDQSTLWALAFIDTVVLDALTEG